jgi:hypothetical protein
MPNTWPIFRHRAGAVIARKIVRATANFRRVSDADTAQLEASAEKNSVL